MTPDPARTARRVVILRHGETTHNAQGVWQGHNDSPLSQTGLAQAERAAPLVAAFEPQLIVSSDLQRAVVTADAVAAVTGLPVRRDVRLREIDVGDWSGRTTAAVRASDGATLEAIASGLDARRGGTGETVAELAARARAAVDDALEELEPGGVALVVCHGVTSRAIAASLTALDQMLAVRLLRGLDNGHWAVVGETAGTPATDAASVWRIEQWNVGAA